MFDARTYHVPADVGERHLGQSIAVAGREGKALLSTGGAVSCDISHKSLTGDCQGA